MTKSIRYTNNATTMLDSFALYSPGEWKTIKSIRYTNNAMPMLASFALYSPGEWKTTKSIPYTNNATTMLDSFALYSPGELNTTDEWTLRRFRRRTARIERGKLARLAKFQCAHSWGIYADLN